MSIIAVLCIQDGIIVASDTRKTTTISYTDGHQKDTYQDTYSKTFLLNPLNIGVSFFGKAEINGVDIHDFVKCNICQVIDKNDTIHSILNKMQRLVDTEKTRIVLCGYEKDVPYIYCLYDNTFSRINDTADNLFLAPIFLGQTTAAWNIYKEKYQGKVNYYQMTLSEGIDILQNTVQYAIESETMCGGTVDILLINRNEASWHINKNEYQNVIIK